jgi:hypothetical protein
MIVLWAFAVMLSGSGCSIESGGNTDDDAGTNTDGGNGECQDSCNEGDQFCDGNGYRVCGNYDADDCVEWSPLFECASSSCVDGECTGGCADLCVSGDKQCVGTGTYETCGDYNQDGCTDWGGLTTCDAGLVCDQGECVIACSDECTAGDQRCAAVGNGTEYCGNHDADDCLEFGGSSECPAREICENAICVPACYDECTFGEQRCVTGVQAYETCADHNGDACTEWGGQTDCPPEQFCEVDTGLCMELAYPDPPHGIQIGDTIANECLERCLCSGSTDTGGEQFCLEDFLGSRAILITVHAGW